MRDDLYDRTDWKSFVAAVLDRQGRTRRELAAALQVSPAQLSAWMTGQRELDPARADDLASALSLDGEARAWLAALVDLESRSTRARRAALATVQSRQQQRASPDLTAEAHDAIAHWGFEVLVELAACDGFRPDPQWLASKVVPALSEDQARELLNLALRLGRIAVTDEGYTITHAISPPVLPKDRAIASATQRRAFRELADHAMRRPANERHDGSITMALSESRATLILARIRELEQEIVQLAIDDPEPRNRVYHLGIQHFPVSEYTDTEPEEGEG